MTRLDPPRTVEHRVLETLRRLILDGTLAPGQRLKQEEIAEHLGVSKTPVQHAFKKLQSEGYVTGLPHRSVMVAPLSADEVEELYAMRIGLEGFAARLAAPALTPERIDRLRALNEEMAQAAREGDLAVFLERDHTFHRTLYSVVDRPGLLRRIDALRDQCHRYMRANVRLPGQVAGTLAEHAAIVNACAAGDHDRVVELVQSHLAQIAGRLVGNLRQPPEATIRDH